MRRGIALTIVVLVVAPCASSAAGWRVVASSERFALYPNLDVSANVSRPTAVALRVTSYPLQETLVKWLLVCSKGAKRGSTSGSYKPQTTALQMLRMPMASPGSCKVAAHGSLPNGGGTLTMKIYSRS